MPSRFVNLLVLVLLATGCGSTGDSVAESPDRATGATPPKTPEPDVAETATTAPNIDASETATTAPNVDAATEPWEVVGIGDSFIGWSTVTEQYAQLLGEDAGADVSVGKIVSPTSNRLEYLRSTETASDLLSTADVVIVQPQPGPPSGPAWRLYSSGDCGGVDNEDCFRSARADFEIYIGDLFDEVITMTPDHTIIVATLVGAWGVAAFNPGLEESDPETYRLFVDHVVALQELSAQAATERGIPAVDVTLAFHGPDPYQPAAEEYLLPDRTHLTDEGSRVVAELLFGVATPNR